MSYTPTNWQTGDVVTAEKMNHMENGIEANDCPVISWTTDYTNNTDVLDVTFEELSEYLWTRLSIKLHKTFIENNEVVEEYNCFGKLMEVDELIDGGYEMTGIAVAENPVEIVHATEDQQSGAYVLSDLHQRFNSIIVKEDGTIVKPDTYYGEN